MLTIKIELWPLGDEERAREIGRMYIANDGRQSSQDPSLGDYQVAVCRRGSDDVPRPIHPNGPKPTRAAEVKGYPRLAYNVWRLIARAVTTAFPEERHVKPGTTPLLEPSVLRGLRFLADQWATSPELAPELQVGDVTAAIAWLDAALKSPGSAGVTLEPEPVKAPSDGTSGMGDGPMIGDW